MELLAASYDQYGAEKRGCVGVRWDLFERQDLVEIVQVSLSTARSSSIVLNLGIVP